MEISPVFDVQGLCKWRMESGMTARNGEELTFSADRYHLTFAGDRPFVYLDDERGTRLADLFVLSGVQPLEGRDDTTTVGPWRVEEVHGETVFSLPAGSSAWSSKTYRFRCTPTRFTYDVTVEGDGHLAEVTYFGGYSSAWPRWGSGFFPSGHTFERGFNPEPGDEGDGSFDPGGGAVIDLVGAPLPGKRHWFFNPAPFCFTFAAAGRTIGIGVEAAPGANAFTEFRYHGGTGFHLSLSYEGHTAVRGLYRLPAIGFDFAASACDALGAHVAALRSSRNAPVPGARRPEWWGRPIFCGWGAQCYRAAAEHGYTVDDPSRADADAFLATMRYAAGYARQEVYDEFLAALAAHDVHPGTVVLDDKWQQTYGENGADEEKWPDLRGFVDRRHAAGQKVLLWLKAWDREGIPDGECMSNAAGVPLAVDPTNAAYERRLRASVRRMVGSAGYDADGFKIDFTHRIPVGPGLRAAGEIWGLELMKRYLGIIHDEAKLVKPDALIVTHTPHPYLADVLDMIRLNDMLDLTRLDDPDAGREIGPTLARRAGIAGTACPEALIDTDNWPVRNKAIWREYLRLQPAIGVPSLYFATHIDLTGEPLEADDYRAIREAWACSRPE